MQSAFPNWLLGIIDNTMNIAIFLLQIRMSVSTEDPWRNMPGIYLLRTGAESVRDGTATHRIDINIIIANISPKTDRLRMRPITVEAWRELLEYLSA